jgi:hypothetical protein
MFQKVAQVNGALIPIGAESELVCKNNPNDDSCLAWFDVLSTLLTMEKQDWEM